MKDIRIIKNGNPKEHDAVMVHNNDLFQHFSRKNEKNYEYHNLTHLKNTKQKSY
jgi:hypothetical protein